MEEAVSMGGRNGEGGKKKVEVSETGTGKHQVWTQEEEESA